VLPALERRHDVLALTLPGHVGAPALPADVSADAVLDQIELAMDDAGFATAHLVGNSLGGYLALRLAARDRARSVVALAPAGGWAVGDDSYRDTLALFTAWQAQLRAIAPHADAIVRTAEGRRRATCALAERCEHIPPELVAHGMNATANCPGVALLIDSALREGWTLDAERVTCPVRILWGTEDRLLAWPSTRGATPATGCRRPTGSCSTASGTARSSTCRCKPRS